MKTPRRYLDPADLPDSLKEVNALIGFEPTMALVEEFGGQVISVPVQPLLLHPLVDVLGIDLASRFIFAYSGEHLNIPTCHTVFVRARDRRIREQRQKGKLIRELVSEFGLTKRWIIKICKTA